MDRVLGRIDGDLPGPLVICVAALHGNEQVGLHAFRNVFSSINSNKLKLRGTFIGIAGNIQAIERGSRFIKNDLNRIWDIQNVNRILQEGPKNEDEEELLAIHHTIDALDHAEYTMKVLADLHSTSSEKGNFIVIPAGESENPVIRALHLPVVVNLNSYIEGTMLDYYYAHGFISFAMEGGRMGTEEVYHLHTSGIWELLDAAGAISHHDHEYADHYARQLMDISSQLPKRVRALHRHVLTGNENFVMKPGYSNFQSIRKGEKLGQDNKGEVLSPMEGMIFMPLYQSEGEDGFFIVEEI